MAPTIRSLEIVIGLILFKSSGIVLEESGIADAWGIGTTTGGDSDVFQQANQTAANQEFSQTPDLFNLFASFADGAFRTILEVAFQSELLLVNAGVPSWLVVFVTSPMYLIVFRDLYYIVSSR